MVLPAVRTSEIGGDGNDADDGDDDGDDGHAEADAAEGTPKILPVATEVQLKTYQKLGHRISRDIKESSIIGFSHL